MTDQDERAAAALAWEDSARAYIAFQDNTDYNRTLLLDPVMLEQCADVAGRRVLDLGCGEGRFGRMLAARGAAIVGIDPTLAMVATARERGSEREAHLRAAAEALPFADASFDVVVSYVTLVDIVRYADAIAECARVLRSGGRFVVANLGFPTASDGWERDGDGRRLFRRIDAYLTERAQVYEWSGMRIINWHRPLSSYMRAFLGAGLVLRAFLEPAPTDQSLRDDQRFEDWFRVPEFWVMRWERAAS